MKSVLLPVVHGASHQKLSEREKGQKTNSNKEEKHAEPPMNVAAKAY